MLRRWTAYVRSVTLAYVGGTTEVFEDDRGRALRVTWHPDAQVVTVSIWNHDSCVGSVRLDTDGASRLSTLLIDAWVTALRLQLDPNK